MARPANTGAQLNSTLSARLVCVALAICSPALGAQSDSAAILPLDYQFTVDLPDTGAVIMGDARITLRRRAPADSLTLDLIGLDVQRVDVDANSVKFRRTDSAIVIPIPRSTPARFTVRVVYDGAPTDGLIVSKDSAGRWTYFGDNWPTRARH